MLKEYYYPMVSVIICTYNRYELVLRALNSVRNQRYKKLEIIVVDDNSSDNTKELLSNVKDSRIKLVSNVKNLGVSKASNIGFSHSSGEFIALLGDDDYWIDDNKIKDQVNCFIEDSKLGVVGTWWEEFSTVDSTIFKPSEPKNWVYKVLSGGGVIGGSTAMISRKAWLKVNGFDEKLKRGTDSNLFRRIILNDFKGKIIRKITTKADVNPSRNRITHKNSISSLLASIHTYEHNLNTLKKHYNLIPKAKSVVYYNLGKDFKSLYSLQKVKTNYNFSTSYFYKSFRTCFFHKIGFKAYLKFIYNKLMYFN